MRRNKFVTRKYRQTKPPEYTPKFKPGQRVRASEEGILWKAVKKGTMGTVEHCGMVVQVVVDGKKESVSYWPDHWDAVNE